MAIFLSVSKITRKGSGENRGQGGQGQGRIGIRAVVPLPLLFLSSHADTLFVKFCCRAEC